MGESVTDQCEQSTSQSGDLERKASVPTGEKQWVFDATVISSDNDESQSENPLRIPSPSPGAVSRMKRPTREVLASVDHIFNLRDAHKKVKSRIHNIAGSLLENQCPVPELMIFYSYLQALLSTMMTPIAGFAEGKEQPDNPIVMMLEPSVINDTIAAAKVSLKSFHDHCAKNRTFLPKFVSRRKSAAAASPVMHRRLSCRASMLPLPHRNSICSEAPDLTKSFSEAFTEGHVQADENNKPKRRPDTRIDRVSSSSATPVTTPRPIRASLDPNSSLRMGPTRSHSICGVTTHQIMDTSQLDLMQYFDIIIETICAVLCVKFERQLMELTIDGDASGVRRAAEWIAARMLDELYNDGIDPLQALDTQLMLCAEGLALEDGQYVWRRASVVDQEVMAVVWGIDPPADILDGLLCSKDHHLWYEWGAFAQPGIRTPEGRLYTSPRLNPLQYRYRLGTAAMVESLQLRNTSQTPLRAPSFLHVRPGEQLAGDSQFGITLSAPPEGSEHRGVNVPKPHIRPSSSAGRAFLEAKYRERYGAEEDDYEDTYVVTLFILRFCTVIDTNKRISNSDTDLYAWSFEEALKAQRESEGASYTSFDDEYV